MSLYVKFLRLFSIILLILLPLFTSPEVLAADYVLPYPSFMPGNKLYVISRIWDQLNSWWHWGSLASVKYHLRLSDKYLVEAKTLFEYKQFLYGVDALKRSDEQFEDLLRSFENVRKDHKDPANIKETVKEAAIAHINVLVKLSAELPAEYIWSPEKQESSRLPLKQMLQKSIEIRQSISNNISGL